MQKKEILSLSLSVCVFALLNLDFFKLCLCSMYLGFLFFFTIFFYWVCLEVWLVG